MLQINVILNRTLLLQRTNIQFVGAPVSHFQDIYLLHQ